MHFSLIICIEKASFKTRKRSLKFIDINIELNKTLVGKYFIQITSKRFCTSYKNIPTLLFVLPTYEQMEMVGNFSKSHRFLWAWMGTRVFSEPKVIGIEGPHPSCLVSTFGNTLIVLKQPMIRQATIYPMKHILSKLLPHIFWTSIISISIYILSINFDSRATYRRQK